MPIRRFDDPEVVGVRDARGDLGLLGEGVETVGVDSGDQGRRGDAAQGRRRTAAGPADVVRVHRLGEDGITGRVETPDQLGGVIVEIRLDGVPAAPPGLLAVLRGAAEADAIGADPAAADSLDALARAAGVSPRHLRRLFRAETGMTPGQYVETVRLEAARALLEAGNDAVETVAEGSGFGSAETMRRTFQQTLGVPPTVYRARFRSTAPTP